eukprot:TRINITY_DN5458_c0_g1_i1.p1 TRINITY_DN5458_c0_g1~~TRINITY_DN5458_c0_g1_i1.p1  ORF type:complete len:366 (-),score=77.11 TRINITY_DN5458_c0_g1_i1:96-1193(-)
MDSYLIDGMLLCIEVLFMCSMVLIVLVLLSRFGVVKLGRQRKSKLVQMKRKAQFYLNRQMLNDKKHFVKRFFFGPQTTAEMRDNAVIQHQEEERRKIQKEEALIARMYAHQAGRYSWGLPSRSDKVPPPVESMKKYVDTSANDRKKRGLPSTKKFSRNKEDTKLIPEEPVEEFAQYHLSKQERNADNYYQDFIRPFVPAKGTEQSYSDDESDDMDLHVMIPIHTKENLKQSHKKTRAQPEVIKQEEPEHLPDILDSSEDDEDVILDTNIKPIYFDTIAPTEDDFYISKIETPEEPTEEEQIIVNPTDVNFMTHIEPQTAQPLFYMTESSLTKNNTIPLESLVTQEPYFLTNIPKTENSAEITYIQ